MGNKKAIEYYSVFKKKVVKFPDKLMQLTTTTEVI